MRIAAHLAKDCQKSNFLMDHFLFFGDKIGGIQSEALSGKASLWTPN